MKKRHSTRKIERDSFVAEKIGAFSRRVTELATERKSNSGKSIAQQAEDMHIQKSNFSKYKESNDYDKDIPSPRADVLLKISKYYDVSIDYLLGMTDYEQKIDTEDKEFLQKVCDYTGLTEQSVKFLHKHSKTEANKLIFNNLFCDTELISALVAYFEEPFLNIFVESDYYHRLPVGPTEKKKLESLFYESEHQKTEKANYANLIETLPAAKKRISEKTVNNPQLKTKIAFDFAKIYVSHKHALSKIRDAYLDSEKINNSLSKKLSMLVANFDYLLIKEIIDDVEPVGKSRFNTNKPLLMLGERIDLIKGIDSYLNFTEKNSDYNYQDESLTEEERIIKAINYIKDLECDPDISVDDLLSEKEKILQAIDDMFSRLSK